MGKRPVVGLTALWLGLAVFGCDCCSKKNSFRKDSTWGPPPNGKDVSAGTKPTQYDGQPMPSGGTAGNYTGANATGARPMGNYDQYSSQPRTTDITSSGGNYKDYGSAPSYTGPSSIGTRSTGSSEAWGAPPARMSDTGATGKSPLGPGNTSMNWNDAPASSVTPVGGSYPNYSSQATAGSRNFHDDGAMHSVPSPKTSDAYGSDSGLSRSYLDDHKPLPPTPSGFSKTPAPAPLPDSVAGPMSSAGKAPPAPASGLDFPPATSTGSKDPLGSLPSTKTAPSFAAPENVPPPPSTYGGDKMPGG
jgi:hypothetical protein